MDSQTEKLAGTAIPAGASRAAELSVIVPTYNESENVPLLVAKLGDALAGIDWEVMGGVDPAKLIPVLHYDGTPITARFIAGEISQSIGVAGRPAITEAAE